MNDKLEAARRRSSWRHRSARRSARDSRHGSPTPRPRPSPSARRSAPVPRPGHAAGQGRPRLSHPVRQAPRPVADSPDPDDRCARGRLGGGAHLPAPKGLHAQGQRPAARGVRGRVPDRSAAGDREGSPGRRDYDSGASALPGLRRDHVLQAHDDPRDLDAQHRRGRREAGGTGGDADADARIRSRSRPDRQRRRSSARRLRGAGSADQRRPTNSSSSISSPFSALPAAIWTLRSS